MSNLTEIRSDSATQGDPGQPHFPRWFVLMAGVMVALFGIVVGGLATMGLVVEELSLQAAIPPMVIGVGSVILGGWMAMWGLGIQRRRRPLQR